MWMIKKITETLLLFLFPSYCYLCKKENGSICIDCIQKRARSIDTPAPFITSIYSFKDPSIKRIIHAIKYFHRKDLIRPLVTPLAKELNARTLSDHVLVPIPMPRLRRYMRGYNHAQAIAYELSLQTNIPVLHDVLVRSQSKKRQVTTRSRKERIKNQHGAFSVTTKNIVAMRIILVDDVTTTGATLLEAREALLHHGALSVEAVTIAH